MSSITGMGSVFSQYKKIDGIGNNLGSQKNVTKGFQDVLSDTLKDAVKATKDNEKLVNQKAFEQVDLTKVTTDTAQLDVMISTITALRDKVVNAIQELQKMPI